MAAKELEADGKAAAGSLIQNGTFGVQRRYRQKTACDDADLQSTDHVITNCASITSSAAAPYQFVVNSSINVKKWDAFTANLQSVTNVDILIEQSSITTLDITNKLKAMDVKNFSIKNNEHLEKIIIRATKDFDVGSLTIEGNSKLSSVTISIVPPDVIDIGLLKASIKIVSNPMLETVEIIGQILQTYKKLDTDLIITDNENLKKIDLKIKEINISGNVEIRKNPMLDNLVVSEIETLKIAKQLLVTDNNALPTFNLGKLHHFSVTEATTISRNSKLEDINLGYLTSVKLPNFEIHQNDRLTQIRGGGPNLEKYNDKQIVMNVHGNKKLPETGVLEKLRHTWNEIQDEGECMFPNEVKQLSELDGCKAVWRELKLAMGVQGTTSTKLAKVTGDIELANVNIGDLEFLNGTTITGTITSNTCNVAWPSFLTVQSTACTTSPSTTTTIPSPVGGGPAPAPGPSGAVPPALVTATGGLSAHNSGSANLVSPVVVYLAEIGIPLGSWIFTCLVAFGIGKYAHNKKAKKKKEAEEEKKKKSLEAEEEETQKTSEDEEKENKKTLESEEEKKKTPESEEEKKKTLESEEEKKSTSKSPMWPPDKRPVMRRAKAIRADDHIQKVAGVAEPSKEARKNAKAARKNAEKQKQKAALAAMPKEEARKAVKELKQQAAVAKAERTKKYKENVERKEARGKEWRDKHITVHCPEKTPKPKKTPQTRKMTSKGTNSKLRTKSGVDEVEKTPSTIFSISDKPKSHLDKQQDPQDNEPPLFTHADKRAFYKRMWKSSFLKKHFHDESNYELKDITRLYKPAELHVLMYMFKKVYKYRPALVDLPKKKRYIIVGDIHGHYKELQKIFKLLGGPGRNLNLCFVFLGDYVDRNPFGLAVMAILMQMKIRYPEQIEILRGNHETKAINYKYGFHQEVIIYREACTWIDTRMNEVFDCLPLAAFVMDKYLCMHGGIGPELTCLNDLRKVTTPLRSHEIGGRPLVWDCLWADPHEDTDGSAREPENDDLPPGFNHNDGRHTSVLFGAKAVDKLSKAEKKQIKIYRGHQLPGTGYVFFLDGKVTTIFSNTRYRTANTQRMNYSSAGVLEPNGEEYFIVFGKPGEMADEIS